MGLLREYRKSPANPLVLSGRFSTPEDMQRRNKVAVLTKSLAEKTRGSVEKRLLDAP